jgi:hypothetical protein
MVAYNPLNSPPVGTRDQWEWQSVSLTDFDDQDNPSIPDPAYYQQVMAWEPVRACLEGTSYLRQNAARYLPQQPMELDASWQGRVSRSVFSPYFQRVVRTAVGLVLRKPIVLDGGDEGYWDEWRADCDRQGTDLDEFIRNQLFLSVAYGHCSWLVDFPDSRQIKTLRDQYQADLKPYFVEVDPWSIIGWRQDPRKDLGKLQQVRMKEVVSVPKGRFGNEYKQRVRVMEPDHWEVWERQEDGPVTWAMIEDGPISVGEIPLVTTYAGKMGTLFSKPPMGEVAQLNLTHYQRHADLIQALHVAAQPLLILKGWDDQTDPVGLSVNNALVMPPEGDAKYVEPASSAFDAQRAELEALVDDMKTLGLAVLTQQKNQAESGLSKSLDRMDANSMLAVISKDLEGTLQKAMDLAAAYAGVQAPTVALDRDFQTEALDGHGITSINTIFQSGLIDQQTALELLKRGEILDDSIDVETVLAASELEQQQSMEQEMSKLEMQTEIAAKTAPQQAPPEG